MYELFIDGPRKGKGTLQDQLVGFQGNEQMIQPGEQAEDTLSLIHISAARSPGPKACTWQGCDSRCVSVRRRAAGPRW